MPLSAATRSPPGRITPLAEPQRMRHDSQSGITWQLLPFGLLVVLATGAGRVESGPSSAVTHRAVTDRARRAAAGAGLPTSPQPQQAQPPRAQPLRPAPWGTDRRDASAHSVHRGGHDEPQAIRRIAPSGGPRRALQAGSGHGSRHTVAVCIGNATELLPSCIGTATGTPASCTGTAMSVSGSGSWSTDAASGSWTSGLVDDAGDQQTDIDASWSSDLVETDDGVPVCDLDPATDGSSMCPRGCVYVAAVTPTCDLDAHTDGTAACPDGCEASARRTPVCDLLNYPMHGLRGWDG